MLLVMISDAWLPISLNSPLPFSCAFPVIFKVYDSDCNGKVTFKDLIEVLQDLSGSFMTDKQREVWYCTAVLVENHNRVSILVMHILLTEIKVNY